jgi:beta-N-acetylhexosaminidase
MSSSRCRDLRRAAGEVLIVGVEGPSLNNLETAWLKLIRPAGIILFRRNIESAQQTHALLGTAQKVIDGAIFRCIDVEGGTVDRLRDLVAPMPSAYAVAVTQKASLFATHGRLIGRELRLLGLNVTFAPALDLRTAASENVLTTRAVSGDPMQVTEYARHFLKGLADEGVLGCGKHFPGLGGGQVDSHHTTPRIDKSFSALWKEDLLPYRKLARRLAFVMISHGSYPATRSESDPASVSSFWVTQILCRKIGFSGLVVSDDMEMGGILSQAALGEATIRALLAGTHLIEICRDPALILLAYEAILKEAETSPAFARRLLKTAAHVESFKKKHLKAARLPESPSATTLGGVRARIQRFSAQLSKFEKAADSGRGALA